MTHTIKLFAIFLFFSLSSSAYSGEIADKDLEFLLEESYVRFDDQIYKRDLNPEMLDELLDESDLNPEKLLFLLAKKFKTSKETLPRFSSSLAIDLKLGSEYARLIIASLEWNKKCQVMVKVGACDLGQKVSLLNQITTTGFKDSTGRVLAGVGKYLYREESISAFMEAVYQHSAYESIMQSLYDSTGRSNYLEGLVEKYGPKPRYFAMMLNKTHSSLITSETVSLGYHLTDIDSDKELPRYSSLQFKVWLLSDLIRLGLTERANNFYLSLPTETRSKMWSLLENKKNSEFPYSRIPRDLPVDLASSLIVENSMEEATKVLDLIDIEVRKLFSTRGNQKYLFLKEYLKPKFSPNQVYEVFIDGFTEGVPKPEISKEKEVDLGIESKNMGWLWTLRNGAPSFRRLGHEYLIQQNYPKMAHYLMGQKIFEVSPGNLLSKKLSEALGKPYQLKLAEIESQILKMNRLDAEANKSSATAVTPLKLYLTDRPVLFEEKQLPKKLITTEEERKQLDSDKEFKLPEGIKLPVSKYQVARIEKSGDEWILIYTSHSLDPVGEVSQGGYWISKSTDDGMRWSSGRYLGIQQYYPYDVLRDSKMPLQTDGKITLEVAVRELDENSITLPPIALQTKRREDGLYLEFYWDELEKDSDGDNLTDAVEMRLGLNPMQEDTDGDGLIDGADSIPHLPFEKGNGRYNEIALTILEKIYDYEIKALIPGMKSKPDSTLPEPDIATLIEMAARRKPGRTALDSEHTLFLKADPNIFVGLDLPIRLVLYTDEELKAMSKQYGEFYPAEITGFFTNKDNTNIYVIWHSGWTGGEFKLIKTKKGFKVEDISNWVT